MCQFDLNIIACLLVDSVDLCYMLYILKQKSLATQNPVGIIFIIKIPVLKCIKNWLLKFVYMLTIRS